MISSELSSLLQREVTSQFISDAESCSVSLKKEDLSLPSTVDPREAPASATFARASLFWYPCSERYRVTLSEGNVNLLSSRVYVAQTFCKQPHLHVSCLKSLKSIRITQWSFLLVSCIPCFLDYAHEKTRYKILTTKNRLSSLVSSDDLERSGQFASIIQDYLRGILHQRGFDYGIF